MSSRCFISSTVSMPARTSAYSIVYSGSPSPSPTNVFVSDFFRVLIGLDRACFSGEQPQPLGNLDGILIRHSRHIVYHPPGQGFVRQSEFTRQLVLVSHEVLV